MKIFTYNSDVNKISLQSSFINNIILILDLNLEFK